MAASGNMYPCKYENDNEAKCSFRVNGNENDEHIFFYCRKFVLKREVLGAMKNERVTQDNRVSYMLWSVEVLHYVKMMSAKMRE